jgi:hypothetical protein
LRRAFRKKRWVPSWTRTHLSVLGREVILETSEELRGFLSALIETFGTPRMGPAFADAIAAEPGVLLVGRDPAEWWGDPDDLLRVVQVQSKELQGAADSLTSTRGRDCCSDDNAALCPACGTRLGVHPAFPGTRVPLPPGVQAAIVKPTAIRGAGP